MPRPSSDFRDPSAIASWEHCCVPSALALLHLPEVWPDLFYQLYEDRCLRLQEHTRDRHGYERVEYEDLNRLLRKDYKARHVVGYNHDQTAPTLRQIAWRRGFRQGTYFLGTSGNNPSSSHAMILRDGRVHDNHSVTGTDFGVDRVRVYEIWEIRHIPFTVTKGGHWHWQSRRQA